MGLVIQQQQQQTIYRMNQLLVKSNHLFTFQLPTPPIPVEETKEKFRSN
jgi:hypothetical protein